MFAFISATIVHLPLSSGNAYHNDETALGKGVSQEDRGFGAIDEASFCVIAMMVAWLVVRRLWPSFQKSTPKDVKCADADDDVSERADTLDARGLVKQPTIDKHSEPKEKLHRGNGSQSRSDFMCERIAEFVREGRVSDLPKLLDRAREAAVSHGIQGVELQELCVNHLIAALRAYKGQKFASRMLHAYDHVKRHLGIGSSLLWSLLLGAAIDAEEFDRYDEFLNHLLRGKKIYGHDCVSIVRQHIHTNDPEGLERQLVALRDAGFAFDNVSRSRALTYCFSANAFNIAKVVASDRVCGTKMDTAGYNALMNGFLKAGEHNRCFDIHARMLASGLSPSDVTFGILLECCSTMNDPDRAKKVFHDLQESGLSVDEVHYATYMKVLSNAGHFDEARQVLDDLYTKTNAKPRRGIFAILLKAMSQQGQVMKAIDIVGLMVEYELWPEQTHFSNVLKGCCVHTMQPSEIFRALGSLMHYGMLISTTNLSIVLKALAMSESWSCALEVLSEAKERFDIWPEPRLFGQLAWSCAKAGRGKKAKETYEAMVRCAELQGVPLDREWNMKVQSALNAAGEWQAAAQIHQKAKYAQGVLSQKDESDAANCFPRAYVGPLLDLPDTALLEKEFAKYGNVDKVLCNSSAENGNSWALVQFETAEEAANFEKKSKGRFKLPHWTHTAKVTRRAPRGDGPRKLAAKMDALSGQTPGLED